jgi:hypothetical protein
MLMIIIIITRECSFANACNNVLATRTTNPSPLLPLISVGVGSTVFTCVVVVVDVDVDVQLED